MPGNPLCVIKFIVGNNWNSNNEIRSSRNQIIIIEKQNYIYCSTLSITKETNKHLAKFSPKIRSRFNIMINILIHQQMTTKIKKWTQNSVNEHTIWQNICTYFRNQQKQQQIIINFSKKNKAQQIKKISINNKPLPITTTWIPISTYYGSCVQYISKK